MGLHLASCGAVVSSARSVISDRAAVPSHPGRCADGLMCGEMSREQSLAPSLSACAASSLLSVYLSRPPLPSFSSLSLHLPHLSLSPPFSLHASFSSPPLCAPLPPPRGGCVLGLQSLCHGGRGTRREARQNELTETSKPISGLCYRKICPFTLRRAGRRADVGRVMGRCFCFGGATGQHLHTDRLRSSQTDLLFLFLKARRKERQQLLFEAKFSPEQMNQKSGS